MIIQSITAIIVTLIIGPFMFKILSQHYANGKKLKKYPVMIIDGWGDMLFLPLFNAAALFTIESFNPFIATIACALALIITSAFVKWRKDLAHHNDWSRPRKYVFNNGAWYHAIYMFIQASFVFYSLILYPEKLILWIPLTGYLILYVIRMIQVHEKVNDF